MNLEILYCDDQIVAVNKPAGLLSIPDGYNKTLPNLKNLLSAEFSKVWTVHRLDKETSGVIVFALTAQTHKQLSLQFETRKIEKTYLALVWGEPAENSFTIDVPLRVNGDRKHRTVADFVNGKPAQTRIEVIRKQETYTMVEVHPKTGYIHQIRSHLLHIGHPVVNDPLYSGLQLPADFPLPSNRLMLHALSISFVHPTLESPFILEAPIPVDFSMFI